MRRVPGTRATRAGHQEQGQILVLFVLSLVVLLSVGALLLDGASALVTRRRMQNAGDAAALAAANTLGATGSTHLCSNVSSAPPGAPRADIVAAVTASLAINWPGFDPMDVTITCPDGWENQAVRVDLQTNSASYLGAAIGFSAPLVATTSVAVNGQVTGTNYSIVLLDPSNASWPHARRGCPSFLISGGPTLQFDGSVMINSTCTAANGGALAANGGAASVTMATGRSVNMVGGYSLGPLTMYPAPNTGATPFEDPLGTIEALNVGAMTVRSSSRIVLNNETRVFEPGVYTGGIQLRNSSVALLRPGIYVLDGGGLDIGAQASFCSITATSIATNCSSFATDCPDVTCGVMLFNRGTATGSTAMGQISVGAGSTLKLRAYDDRANGNVGFEYRNILIWQDASPAASATYAQPIVQLSGGGNVEISGTVYAPQGKVLMGGNSGGSGGNVNLLLQFIAWDLEMSGNSSFRFYYSDAEFARPKDYGLVQ
jgi:Flp pilus assembly protein TadG